MGCQDGDGELNLSDLEKALANEDACAASVSLLAASAESQNMIWLHQFFPFQEFVEILRLLEAPFLRICSCRLARFAEVDAL